MSGDNVSGNIIVAKESLRSDGILMVKGRSEIGSVETAKIYNDAGDVTVNGVTMRDGAINASKLTIGDETIKLAKITYLTNEDFEDGTYRIRESGRYVLSEDIVFNPDPASTRADRHPSIDWFAAITVECDHFEIDGNGFSLSTGTEFFDGHIQKVFSLIELSNAPFPGVPFPITTVSFVGETEFKRARFGKIHNINFGLSSHHAIHGNGNSDIVIENFHIADHEVAGISLNSAYNITIQDGTISGSQHEIVNRGRPAQLKSLLESLRIYEDNPGSAAHITAVDAALTAELAARSQDPITVPDGNTYGISIATSPAAGGPRFSMAECENMPTLDYQKLSSNILIKNVRINDIRAAPLQRICLVGDIAVGPYTAPSAPREQQIVTNHAGSFGALVWEDFYVDGTGAWNVTDVAKAQTWLLQQRRLELALPDSDSYFLPEGFEANILSETPDNALFRTHVKPGFEFDLAHFNKGTIGIKVGCSTGVRIEDCTITRVHNSAPPSLLRANIADGSFYTDSDVNLDSRITGQDAFGISLENCTACVIASTSVLEITSDNGYAHGISIFGDSEGNRVIDCDVKDVVTAADPTTPIAAANPSGQSFGVITDASNKNSIASTRVVGIAAPRCAFGFVNLGGRGNQVQSCPFASVHSTAAYDATRPKKVGGVHTESGSRSYFEKCTTQDVAILAEDGEGVLTNSTACAYRADDDFNVFQSCQATQTDSGAGDAHGFRLEGDGNLVKDKSVLMTYSSNVNGTSADLTDNGSGNVDTL